MAVSVPVTMPKLGLTMKTGKVSKWFKAEGEAVAKGEALLEVETDKITNTVEVPEDGILFQIVVPEGEEVPVTTVVGVIAKPGEQPERLDGPQPGAAPKASAEPAPAAAAGGAGKAAAPKEIVASPAARRLAKELGVDLAMVKGTGREGRINEDDVTKYSQALANGPKITPLAKVLAIRAGLDITAIQGTGEGGKITKEDVLRTLHPEEAPAETPQKAGPEVVPMAGMRKAIADNMSASLMQAAQLTLMTEVDVTECLKLLRYVREQHKRDETFRVSMNDILILVTSRALKKFPRMNSTQSGDAIYLHDEVNMGIAVALPEGLIVPVLHGADKKGLEQIAREARVIAGKARSNSLEPDDVTGGTFTISNMARSTVDNFTPILKPAETGILGVGRVVEKPVVHKGQIAIRSMMGLSLTFDHRVVDGAPAGEFLQLLCQFIEQPSLAMF